MPITSGSSPHVLVNGLCVGPGGGYTLARELLGSLGRSRPGWRFTFALTDGSAIHEEFRTEALPENVALLWTPGATANRAVRSIYERTGLARWTRRHQASAVVQLNGMLVPSFGLPTVSVHSNPMPYREDLWAGNPIDHAVYYLQRREHVRSLRQASFTVWVSNSLRALVCDRAGFEPERDEVVHLGLAQCFDRDAEGLPAWNTRPMEVLTVSNVVPHKRQSLMIRALGLLVKQPGFGALRYRIVGDCSRSYRAELERIARDVGVSDRVIFEDRVPQSRVREAYLNARVLAFMSVCECFGLPPIEAMASGTPSIVAESSSAREIYGDAVEYCPPDDLEALVARLAVLLTDEGRAAEIGELGRARAHRYSWNTTGERMAAILDGVMRDARR